MKSTSQIRAVVAAGAVAAGLLVAAGTAVAADATKPTYNGYQPKSSDPNGNDHHANYHADYSATQNGRPSQPPKADEPQDPRQDSRRFQDGDRYTRYPYSPRR
jgi:hypothetical protein